MKAIGRILIATAVGLAAVPAVAQDKERVEPGKRAELIRLADLSGHTVYLKDGKTEIGKVKDVVVDVNRGRAVYAAVAPKNDTSKIVGVPVTKFKVKRTDDGKKIEAFWLENEKDFANAPGATQDEWDRTDDRMVMGRLAGKSEGVDGMARADYLKKASVVDARGERIGEVDEIMVNLDNGRMLALVGVGGVLGVGERRHVVPWEILRTREYKKEGPASFTLNVPKDRLEKGPVLGKDEENRLSDPAWVAGLYEHYQYGPLGGDRAAAPRVVTAENLIGLDVMNANKPDDDIGSIEGLAIVPHTGQIAYVAFDHDGKLYAIPLDAFKFTFDDKKVKAALDADKASFASKAHFKSDRWPDRADGAWMKDGAKDDLDRRDGVAPLVLRSSDVLDADVKDARRVSFGEIEDFLVDLDGRRVAFVAVGSGGFLGIGETMYAIPWKAMSWAGDKDKFFTVNADRKTLERSVHYDEKRFTDAGYCKSVCAIYGLECPPAKGVDKPRP